MYSTFFLSDSSYLGGSSLQGSSFAAPYVSGTLALMLAQYPTEPYQQTIARLLIATDPLPSLAGKCVSGGRLNLRKALSPTISLTAMPAAGDRPFELRLTASPNQRYVIELTTNLTSWSPLYTNTTSTTGQLDFTDDQSTNSARRFYRARSSP